MVLVTVLIMAVKCISCHLLNLPKISWFPSRNGPFPQSLRLPREMRSLFLWGQSAESLVRRTTGTPPRCSFIVLTLRKIAHFCIGNLICAPYRFMDGHSLNVKKICCIFHSYCLSKYPKVYKYELSRQKKFTLIPWKPKGPCQ
jgi:hypothetical protein